MSAIVKTMTPFINRELLLKALDEIGCKYTLLRQRNEILTDRKDYYGLQKFVFDGKRYYFSHDSSAENMRFGPHYPWGNINMQEYKTVSVFIKALEKQYNEVYHRQLEELERLRKEEDRIRLEKERQEYVEKQKQTVIEKAKKQGYSVREERMKNKIKLVLVRTTY
jgi:hypothetical protein